MQTFDPSHIKSDHPINTRDSPNNNSYFPTQRHLWIIRKDFLFRSFLYRWDEAIILTLTTFVEKQSFSFSSFLPFLSSLFHREFCVFFYRLLASHQKATITVRVSWWQELTDPQVITLQFAMVATDGLLESQSRRLPFASEAFSFLNGILRRYDICE